MYDVTVIGAGVIGAMTARTLSKYHIKTCILDKENDVATGATKANSGIVHAGFDAHPGTLKAKLNVEGSQMMKQITDELGVKYINNGSLVIGYNDEDLSAIRILYEQGLKNGVKGLRIIERNELADLEKGISSDAKYALYAPTGAVVSPYELTIAAIGNAMDNGVDLKCNLQVKGIDYKDGVYKIISDTETVFSRYVVNAAGVYADEIARMIGDNSFSIHPRRGEYILLDKECSSIVSHTIFKTPGKMGKGILVTPTAEGNLLAGPTSVDIDDKENKDTTAEGFEKIIEEALRFTKDISFHKSITSFCGLRAVGDTGDFIINSPKHGFINAAGIESPGLSASPAIAAYIKTLLEESGLALNIKENYNPYRKPMCFFRDASAEEKNEIIKRDKSFGKVICRCETVTEGEILYALRQNPRPSDLDGIKRRTRAQMGRCQGGFCLPYIVRLMSEELGIPYEKITKSGGSSIININKTK